MEDVRKVGRNESRKEEMTERGEMERKKRNVSEMGRKE